MGRMLRSTCGPDTAPVASPHSLSPVCTYDQLCHTDTMLRVMRRSLRRSQLAFVSTCSARACIRARPGWQVDVPEAEDPDAEAAAAAKRRGDEAFVAARFPAAVEAYTRALRHDTGSHALWANRSAALLRTGDYRAALTDARIARTVEPGFTKARPSLPRCLRSSNRKSTRCSVVRRASIVRRLLASSAFAPAPGR